PVCNMRQKWLPNLYRMFAAQDYPGETELIVLDGVCSRMQRDGKPSAFMLDVATKDPRVKYSYDPAPKPPSLGAKRNIIAREKASGEVIAHFDCDDYYGPAYLSRMVVLLMDSGEKTGMVKLHAWLSMGEGWLYDPLRRYRAYTYIDYAVDPLG